MVNLLNLQLAEQKIKRQLIIIFVSLENYSELQLQISRKITEQKLIDAKRFFRSNSRLPAHFADR